MQQARKTAIKVRADSFPKKTPLHEPSSRILGKLPSNIDLIKPILVGLLSVDPDESLSYELASKAARSLKVRNALLEIARNPMVDEIVRGNAAHVLAEGASTHKFSIMAGGAAFTKLLQSDDPEVSYCGAYALFISGIDYLKPKAVERLSKLMLDDNYGWVAAELLLRDLSLCSELRLKHDALLETLEKNFAASIRSDNPPESILRIRMICLLEKLSN